MYPVDSTSLLAYKCTNYVWEVGWRVLFHTGLGVVFLLDDNYYRH